MKKIKVNTEGCYSTVISEENIDVELVQNLVESCPVGVISLVDENDEGCTCEHCHCHDDEAA